MSGGQPYGPWDTPHWGPPPPTPPPPNPYYGAPQVPAQPWSAAPTPATAAAAPPVVGPAYPPPNPFAGQPHPGPRGPLIVDWGAPAPYPPYPPPRRRRARWIWAGSAAAVAVVAVVVGLVVWLVRPAPAAPALALTELNDGVLIGYPDAHTTIDIFDEPLCPHCGVFVTSSSADIERAVDAKKIAVRYHLLNFLDQSSASHDYSTRAVAASFCVAASNDPKMYTNFYVDLFAATFQPPMTATTDHTDADLAGLARSVGASAAADCITSGQLISTAKTKAANGIETLKRLQPEPSTPQVYNDATEVDISAPGWVDRLSSSA